MAHWYALYTKPRHEKKVAETLANKSEEVFLPLLNTKRKLKDRIRLVDLPLFPSYVFCRFEYKNRFSILESSGIIKIVNFNGKPAVVPDWQIESLKKILENPETLQLETYFRQGDMVEVISGPFIGLKGIVKQKKGQSRLMINIDGIMQSISVEIDPEVLEKVKLSQPNL